MEIYDFANIDFCQSMVSYLFSVSIDLKVWVTPYCLYRDLLTLRLSKLHSLLLIKILDQPFNITYAFRVTTRTPKNL